MTLTDDVKRRILEVMAVTEFRCHFEDGRIVRLPARLDMAESTPKYVSTEGFDHAGVIDRVEACRADGTIAVTIFQVKGTCVIPGHPGFSMTY